MASARAQEEKNAKAIRDLMKLIPNKTCFDCGQKGPVYANCTIGTFICTTCSGIHRELSHRCKSVSMSTFTSAEVEKLTAVGNENAAKEWHANWNPSEYPAPDGNDTTYLRKFLFLTYQDKKFGPSSGKGGSDSSHATGSSKSKRGPSPGSSKTKREKVAPLPQPEPLSNILGPNIPTLDVGSSGSTRSGRGGAAKSEAPLINLLDDSPMASAPTTTTSSKPSSKDLLGDLMSLSMAPAPATNQFAHNPFGMGGAPASAPAVDPQQLTQLQQQVQSMQAAILSAQQQMTVVYDQIQQGKAVFNQLNPQQREMLAGLMQRYQAMTTQFGAMTQQYNAGLAKLQQMQAAAAAAAKPVAPPPTDLFSTAFGSTNGASGSHGTSGANMFGTTGGYGASAPSNPSLYGTMPSSTTHSSSNNLFGATTPSYSTTTSSSSSTNLFGASPTTPSYPVSTTVPPSNGSYAPSASTDLFASLNTQPSSHASSNTLGGFGSPVGYTSAPPRNTDFHPFG